MVTRDEVELMLQNQKENCSMVWIKRPSIIAIMTVLIMTLAFCGGILAYQIGTENRLTVTEQRTLINSRDIDMIRSDQKIIIENQNEIKNMIKELRK